MKLESRYSQDGYKIESLSVSSERLGLVVRLFTLPSKSSIEIAAFMDVLLPTAIGPKNTGMLSLFK
jgi:hypothetical protein